MQHGIGGGIFQRNILHEKRGALFLTDQVQSLADGREHAQGEHVHFHQTQAFQVVLVPLYDGTIRHGGVLHRYQFGQWPGTDDKTTDMLGQVAGEAQQGIHQGKELVGHFRVAGEVFVENLLAPVAGLVPPIDAFQ